MPTDDYSASSQTQAQDLILETLKQSEGEAEIDELKKSLWDIVRERETESEQEQPLHFVPVTGSQTPRSRSFNRSLKDCQGSGYVSRENETVELTQRGQEQIDQKEYEHF